MRFKNGRYKEKILQIKKIAKKKKLISSFVIGNTSKPFKKKYYLTPIRFNSKVIFGIVVYDEKVVTKIIKFVDGKIDNIFVDVEKKSQINIQLIKLQLIYSEV